MIRPSDAVVKAKGTLPDETIEMIAKDVAGVTGRSAMPGPERGCRLQSIAPSPPAMHAASPFHIVCVSPGERVL